MCAVEKAGVRVPAGKPEGKKQAPEKNDGPATMREDLKKAFKAADKDGDGKVEKDELKSKAGQAFEAQVLDQNQDGQFSWKESLQSLSFKGRDLNGDGELTGIESKGLSANHVAGEDGKLTAEDYVKGRHADGKDRRDAFEAKAFKKADANADGVLSGNEIDKKFATSAAGSDGRMDLAEFQAAEKTERQAARLAEREKAFAKLDKNQDGVLSGNEIKGKVAGYDQPGTVPIGPPSPADGKVTKDEYLAGLRAEQKKRTTDRLVEG